MRERTKQGPPLQPPAVERTQPPWLTEGVRGQSAIGSIAVARVNDPSVPVPTRLLCAIVLVLADLAYGQDRR